MVGGRRRVWCGPTLGNLGADAGRWILGGQPVHPRPWPRCGHPRASAPCLDL